MLAIIEDFFCDYLQVYVQWVINSKRWCFDSKKGHKMRGLTEPERYVVPRLPDLILILFLFFCYRP